MVLKNILVHLDDTPRSPLRYDLALQLAQRQQACLTAFYSTASPYFSQGAEMPQRKAAHADYAEKAAQSGVKFIWAEADEAEAIMPLTSRIIYQSTYADLCINAHPATHPPPPRQPPERLILASGHPVITIPFAGHFKSLGSRVMIAWRAGRASARALADAMPFMLQADEVILISFCANDEERKKNERSLQKIEHHLSLHGIKAKLENRLISNISLGDALLNRAAEEGIDLLVCGGMVASQLGPLAYHLLQQMTVPVLMSS